MNKIVKKEILIMAPASKVWEHITDPQKIAGWFMPSDFEATVGRAFEMQCSSSGPISCVVKEVVPLQKLSYSFKSDGTKVDTLVTITLAEESGQTRLTLVHSGWEALPPDEQGISDQFENGWGTFLPILAKQLSGPATK